MEFTKLLETLHATTPSASAKETEQVSLSDPFITVSTSEFRELCTHLKNNSELAFDYLRLITAIDAKESFKLAYHFYSYRFHHSLVVYVELKRDEPEIDTIIDLWPTAEWLEREAYDMMGIKFRNHPNLRRILLPHDWDGFPLRKDYQQPASYHGVKHD